MVQRKNTPQKKLFRKNNISALKVKRNILFFKFINCFKVFLITKKYQSLMFVVCHLLSQFDAIYAIFDTWSDFDRFCEKRRGEIHFTQIQKHLSFRTQYFRIIAKSIFDLINLLNEKFRLLKHIKLYIHINLLRYMLN